MLRMRGPALGATLGLLLCGGAILPLPADELLLQAIQEDAARDLPPRGATMDQVRARYGEPARVLPAVGEPPITRWVYDGFTVYFEHDRVISSVVHHRLP